MCSPFIFKDNVRRAENFISTCFLVFDFDNNELTIEKLQERLETWPFNFSILTTKSHTDERHHLRLVIPLSQDITDSRAYVATWKELHKKFPECDVACKDLARLYFKSIKVITSKTDRELFKPLDVPAEEEKKPSAHISLVPLSVASVSKKGKIHPETEKFIREGAPEGKWHNAFVASCLNLKQNGYDINEAIAELEKPTGELDQHDMAAIMDIYANRKTRPPFIQDAILSDELDLTDEDMRTEALADRQMRAVANANRQPFLSDAFRDKHELTIGMTVIAAATGRGKSSAASNIAAHFLKHSKKKLLYISNEETTDDVYSRIACHNLGVDWRFYHEGKLSPERQQQVCIESDGLWSRIKVYRQQKGWDMSDLVSVKKLFSALQKKDYGFGLVILDYLQTIVKDSSIPNSDNERYAALKAFGDFMKDHGRQCYIPTVVLAQLNPSQSNSQQFSDRIQGDRHFANHAVCTIELIPDFEKKTTTFKFHKSRFSPMTGQEVICRFQGGKFIGD